MPKLPDLPQPWQALAIRMGGAEMIALSCKVAYTTVWRWAHGLCSPCKDHEVAVLDLFEKHGVPYPEFRTRGVGDGD